MNVGDWALSSGGDHWFRFDDDTPTDIVAKSAANYLPKADLWWNG